MFKTFLSRVFENVQSFSAKKFVVVIGNEACDMDSIACAVSYAYLLTVEAANKDICYVPICNIPMEDIQLRTEATYWLNYCRIKTQNLFYLETVEKILERTRRRNLELMLVDHHEINVHSLLKNVPITTIIDHHSLLPHYVRPDTCTYFRVERVGSCSSLITDEIMKRIPHDKIPLEINQLLYGAILIDTVGLSEVGKNMLRATEADFKAADQIESVCKRELFNGNTDRETYFKQISDAKFSIVGLSLWDLLRRDFKLINADFGAAPEIVCSTLSGMDFQELVYRQDFTNTANKLCETNGVKIFVCITVGYPLKENRSKSFTAVKNELSEMRRGLVLSTAPTFRELAEMLVANLVEKNNNLQLEVVPQIGQPNSHHFLFTAIINNPQVTRKAIAPLLSKFLYKQANLKKKENHD